MAEVFHQVGGAAQPRAQEGDDAHRRLVALPEERQEVGAAEEQQLGGLARHRRRGAALAVEQRDLAEELARAEHVQDQLLALGGFHA